MTFTTKQDLGDVTRRPPRSSRRFRRSFAPLPRWRRVVLGAALVAGSGLVVTAGAIHLHLWMVNPDYRDISVIGPLFLFQSIAAFVLAVALLASRRLIMVVAAAGFLLATIGGYLISVYVGLFGFKDTLSAPLGATSLGVEAAGVVVLAIAGAMIPRGDRFRLPWQ
ncbi:MAG: hypothetical protein J2O39_01740 [Acidimicrobiales bacterium]|nr:hypothetical protein [Acidimicrobiales bacterium]MBO0893073.1 hypothetical protein [Acidimicrobiales bacterium]